MNFVVARLSIIQDPQLKLFTRQTNKTKAELAEEILQTHTHYSPPSGRGLGFVLGSFLTLDGKLLAAKLGLLRDVKLYKYDVEERQFILKPDDTYDTLILLWDREQQVILLERRSSVHRSPEKLFEHIQHHLTYYLRDYGFQAIVRPLPDRGDFWNAVARFDKILKIRLTLVVPNLFGHTQQNLAQWLKACHADTNATEVTLELSNSEGNLHPRPDDIQLNDGLNWADKGAGGWSVTGIVSGSKRITYSSSKTPKKIHTTLEMENYTAEEAIRILRAVRPEYEVPGLGDD